MASLSSALTIAGSDPSGGAGIQADLKTFYRFGVYGQAAITLITAQNTLGVRRVETLTQDLIAQQIEAVFADIMPRAVKTGALGNAAIVGLVANLAETFSVPLVVDPVMISKHGHALLDAEAVCAFRKCLLPRADLLTPNLHEAKALSGIAVTDLQTMHDSARALADLGAKAVLIKGGHLEGPAIDLLYAEGSFTTLEGARVATQHTHGTGCTYSAAITALLAKGLDLAPAVAGAKQFIQRAIETNPGLGRGSGPVNHWA